jgi:hypothetical protein
MKTRTILLGLALVMTTLLTTAFTPFNFDKEKEPTVTEVSFQLNAVGVVNIEGTVLKAYTEVVRNAAPVDYLILKERSGNLVKVTIKDKDVFRLAEVGDFLVLPSCTRLSNNVTERRYISPERIQTKTNTKGFAVINKYDCRYRC